MLPDMCIRMTGREFISQKEAKPHGGLWFLAAWGQLLMLAGGLCAVFVTGLSLSVRSWMLYPGILVICGAAALFFFGERLNGYRVYGIMAGIIGYALLLFFTQNQFLAGMRQAANAVLTCMNSRYGGSLSLLAQKGDSMALTVFVLEIFVPLAFWLAASSVYRPDVIGTALLLFPAIALLLLAGGSPSVLSLFLLLFGLLSLLAAARSVRKKRMWGEKGSAAYRNNLNCHKNIQKKTMLLVCGVGVVLSVLGFYLVRPGLSVQLKKAETVTAKAEGKLMEAMLRILPGISAGKLNLQVETAGGGVSEGFLGDTEGYALEKVEDLRLTSSSQPEETIYLKGYVGNSYEGDRWLAAEEERFQDAALNWKTEGDPRLYIQNLPFLRALYIEKDTGAEESRMQQLTVERLHADSGYTYYPYCSYLNEYYQVQGGDGYVAGQEEQDDIFSYYPRSVYKEAVESWRKDEDKSSVLDRVEASYGAYVSSCYLEVPEGFEELEQQCREQELKEGDVEEVSAYIKAFLSDGYTFCMDVPKLPEGEDFVKYFLYESKTGYSTHYASAATLMFRMFDIPARYVVGYAAPQNLFTPQPDGTYTAVLQGDNAHAWTEIYVEGEGWTPVEMTPGGLGTLEEVEYQGEPVPEQKSSGNEQEAPEQENPEGEETGAEALWKAWLQGNLESVIHGFLALLLIGGGTAGAAAFLKKRRKALGFGRKLTPEERIRAIFQAYYQSLVKKGMSPEVESFSEDFAEEVKRRNPSLTEEEFSHMMRLVLESCYGFQEKKEEDVEYLRSVYKKLRRDLRLLNKRVH